ncbi:hypothetical protein OSCI_3720002 [Kamptonema sp. PCC 6506]|nr:hypothetical protein OSCI_3720002 [Kamptonema sp. PCC 6506]
MTEAWKCGARIKILKGPLLKPDHKGKVNKYRNSEGRKAPITFLKVSLHFWGKVLARWQGVPLSENTAVQEGEAKFFWPWVQESRADVVLAEGEKKAGCLLTLGHAAIALPGISMGWRVTEKDALGRAIARELHPDLLPFDDGRSITIAFDYRPGDWFESPEFKNAAILARLFKKSTVKIARLPGPQKGIDDFAVAGGDVDRVLALAETVQQLQDERLWRSYRGFSPDKVVNQRYLDIEAPEEGKITAIKSGLGTGKTQYLADKVRPQAGKQINIGYRNSLLLQMAQKLDSYHLDAHGGYQMMNDPEARLSLCWDSLLKVLGITLEDATLILDEASSSIKHLLTSSTCRDIRLSLLDYLKAIAPSVNRVIALDGNLSDSVTDFLAEVFKMPVVKIENQFKGDTPPVTFLELPNGRQRLVKAEFEWLAYQILNSPCPAVATDSLRDAEALAKRLKDEGRKGILLTSKTAVEEWAKEFLANPDEYIRRHKPEFFIYTPTAESGLDISIKDYFSDCFCWFGGVIGVDECFQMSRRVRHPERLIICCPQRKIKPKSDGDFPSKLIEFIAEQATAEAGLLSPESQIEAIASQINSSETKAWARIKAKDNVESRNLQRFLFKRYVEAGFSVQRVALEGLKYVDEYHQAKVFCKETEAKEIFNAEDITLAEALEIERNFNARWPDRCKALKAKLKARLPGIEDTELWTWGFIYRVRFTDRDLLNQLEADWLFKNTEDAEYLQRQKWKREFKTFLPDLSTRWLKLKVLSRLGIDKFLAPGVAWRNDSPEVEELVRQCRKKSVAALLGHPGKLSPIQYLNRLLKIIGAQLIGTQVRDGGDRFWEYRYQVGPEFKKSSRPENWDDLYPLVCQKMTEKVQGLKMSESLTVIDSEVVTAPPLNIQNTAEAVTESSANPTEKVWGVARELADVAARVAEGAIEVATNCLRQVIESFGIDEVFAALDGLPEHQRLAVEGLG